MGVINEIWLKLTPTKVLENTSGVYELVFFEPVYRVLYLLGLSSFDKGFLYSIYSFTVKLAILMLVSSEMWYLIMSSSLDKAIENINATAIHLIALYRYGNMINHKKMFKNLAMSMESPYFDISTAKRRKILEYWLRNNEKYFKLLLALGSCTLMAWYIYPLVDDLEYNLIVPLKIPYDYTTPTRYPPTYAVVSFAFNYVSYFVMVNDLIMQSHLMHILCQFAVLQDCFENILEDCSDNFKDINEEALYKNQDFIDKYIKRLGDLVEQHKFILRNTSELRSVLSIPMLCQMGASSMLICFIAYQATTTASSADITKLLMSLLYLCYNMFELLIFCRWCDEIKMQSENIKHSVYFSGWERISQAPGVRARLMFIIARASRPLVLTAGGVYDLSLTSYATIVKTSYSALSVLLRARH